MVARRGKGKIKSLYHNCSSKGAEKQLPSAAEGAAKGFQSMHIEFESVPEMGSTS